MMEHGLIVNGDLIADGQIHRCDTTGRNGKNDGAYVLHLDGQVAVGGFENHQAGLGWVTWKPERAPIFDPEQKRKMEQAIASMRAKRDSETAERRRKASELASKMWSEARPAEQNHPYLARKNVKSHGLRVGTWRINGHAHVDNALLIPITDGESIISLQAVFPEKNAELGRDKDFLSGGKKSGGFFSIGEEPQDLVVVCEGYATGATIHEATDYPVAVAFDRTNLQAVALNIRARYPLTQIIIAADNDHLGEANHGVEAAERVKQAVGNVVVLTPEFDADDSGTDWNDYAERHGIDAVRQAFGLNQEIPDLFVSVGDLVDNLQPIRWLVDDYIEEDSLSLVFGAPAGGKSFITVDLACCVATGTPWHGHSVTKGAVFYVAGEGHNGLARRFAAWSRHKNVSLKGEPIYKSKRAISVFNENSAIELYQAVHDIAKMTGHTPKLVVLDTVARNFGDGDENSTSDMGKFVEHIDRYVREPFGCNVLLVHHSGHNAERARGSSALKAALDAEYQVVNESGRITITATKMKDAEMPDEMTFKFKPVTLGELDGEEISSVVLEQDNDIMDFVAAETKFKKIQAKDVLEAVFKGWTSFDQLKNDLECDKSAAQRAVKKCVDKGVLIKDGQSYVVSDTAKQALSLTGRNLQRKSNTPIWKRGEE